MMEFVFNPIVRSSLDTKVVERAFRDIRNTLDLIPTRRVCVPVVNRIIYSGNKTVVLWEDGTKTIVGCSDGETYDEFDGFTAALAKKIYGSTCAVKREIRKKSQSTKREVKQ